MTVNDLRNILEDVPEDFQLRNWERLEFWCNLNEQLYGEVSTGDLQLNPKYEPKFRVKEVTDRVMINKGIEYLVTNESKIYYCTNEDEANELCEELNA